MLVSTLPKLEEIYRPSYNDELNARMNEISFAEGSLDLNARIATLQ